MQKLIASVFALFLFMQVVAQSGYDLQGHRGCRGLLPENTIPAFIRAVDLGVNTLELDVVISLDNQVIISHEPYMSAITCTDTTGLPVTKERQKDYRIYGMTAAQVAKFDCGSRKHPDFPGQVNSKAVKPLLSAMIAAVEQHIHEKGLPPVRYNIEIKCSEEGDGVFHPAPEPFVDLVMEVVTQTGIAKRCNIQSFDFRPLRYLNNKYPDITTAVLIANVKSLQANLEALGYTPEIYSPNQMLVNRKLVKKAHQAGMKIIPWTVNKVPEMQKLLSLGVDGLITDYPDRAPGR